jgi:tRNA pseudouridine13 synthase
MSIDEVKQFQEQPHPFKILLGDVMSHYPFGKIFYAELLQEEAIKFNDRDRVPTGLLCGKKTKIAIDKAKVYEDDFNKITNLNGSRRFAWIFPDNIQSNYKEDSNHFELSFSLPKGSYATELISELIH